MKALSLLQPWATLIMLGCKRLETRSWQTKHRGNLAIHASAGKPKWAREVCESDPYIKQVLDKHGLTFDTLPRGAVLGTAGVLNMLPINKELVSHLSPLEFACGDYSMPGRFAWELFSAVALPAPIACQGALSVWEVPIDVVAQIYPHANLSLDTEHLNPDAASPCFSGHEEPEEPDAHLRYRPATVAPGDYMPI